MLLDHPLLNEYLIPSVFLLYLAYRRDWKVEPFFTAIYYLVLLALPVYIIMVSLGFNYFEYLKYSWTTATTPVQYMVFIIVAYALLYNLTDDRPYSITTSLHMALAAGYLYEVPRYIYLQGLIRVLRFNKYSLFPVHYSIISVFLVAWLLHIQEFKVSRWFILGVANYLCYCAVFYLGYEWLQSIRFLTYFGGYMVPWINLYRVPAMLMLLAAASGVGGPEEDSVE